MDHGLKDPNGTNKACQTILQCCCG